MIHLKKFVDKVSKSEGKQQKDIVLPIAEARGLRDEITKLLAEINSLKNEESSKEEVIKVEIKGGTFK
jgi:hypothetical protein